MYFRVITAVLGLTVGTTAIKNEMAPAESRAPWIESCYDYSKSSTFGSVSFATQNSYGETVEIDFDCTYWGDATSCDLDDWGSELVAANDYVYRTVSWDADPYWVNDYPTETHTSGIEFFAATFARNVDDLDDGWGSHAGDWWKGGYHGTCGS